MIQRLLDFYKRASVGADATMGEIWLVITQHVQKGLKKALEEGNGKALQELLNGKLVESHEIHGLEAYGVMEYSDPKYLDLLSRLGRKVGVLPIQNPEQVSPTRNHDAKEIADLKQAVERELGFPLLVPSCFGMDGSKGIPHRFFFYAAAAFTAMPFIKHTPKSILEIGAGLGNMGLIAKAWNALNYVVIDIPSVAVLSAYFTMKHWGESNVWLYGESEDIDSKSDFYPSTDFRDLHNYEFDLIFNSDSFPEMTNEAQDSYIELIANSLDPKDGIFLSINHESDKAGQSRVYDAVKRNGGLRLVSRAPFMLRDGYIEEIYATSL